MVQKPRGKANGRGCSGGRGATGGGIGGSSGRGPVVRGRGATSTAVNRRANAGVAMEVGGPSNSRPSRTPPVNGGPVSPTIGGGQSMVGGTSGIRGGSSMSNSSSQNTISGTASRTRLPAQYPPATQTPSSQQYPLATQTPSAVQLPPPQLLHVDLLDQEEDFGEVPDHDVDMEEEDEVEVPEQEAADFELLLDDLLHIPGREQLVCLSQHPIPNVKTTW